MIWKLSIGVFDMAVVKASAARSHKRKIHKPEQERLCYRVSQIVCAFDERLAPRPFFKSDSKKEL